MMDGVGAASAVIAVVSLCVEVLGYINAVKGSSKDRHRLRAEIIACQSLLEALKEEMEEDQCGEGWQEIIKTLEGDGAPLSVLKETFDLLVTTLLAPKKNLQKVVTALAWPFKEKEISTILDVIERQKSSLSLALENNNRKLAQKISSQVSENVTQLNEVKKLLLVINESQADLKQFYQDKETQNLLNWVSPNHFRYRQVEILKERGKGTGLWILEEPRFIEWTEGNVKTLWCHGIPGAGKTVIAAIVSEYLRTEYARSHPNIGIATLYCDYQKQHDQDLDYLQRSVYRQVLEYVAAIPPMIQEIYMSSSSPPPPPPDVLELRAGLETLSDSLSTVFVVLDALDEASENVQDYIVQVISDLPFPDVRLFCTSRPFSKFEEVFQDLSQIEIRATDADITTFVKAHIEGSMRLRKLVGGDEKLQQEIVEKIIEKAQGMFLMAKLHISSVMSECSKTRIRQVLRVLPSGINDTYKLAMQRIRSQQIRDRILAERALSWVFGWRRQLDIIELQHGLAIADMEPNQEQVVEDDLPHEEIIVSVCQGLLILERKDYGRAFVRPVHYTTAEYFTTTYAEEFPNGHAEIAKSCVAYLSLSPLLGHVLRYCYELENEHEQDEMSYHWGAYYGPDVAVKPWKYRGAIEDNFPLFFYAGEHWSSHLREAHRLKPLISTTRIFWQFGSDSFKWESLLVAPGVSYHAKFKDDIYRIISKAHKQVVPVLEEWVKMTQDVNAADEHGRTMLFYAVCAGHSDAIEFLLALDGIKIIETESEKNDPIFAAIDKGLEDVVRTLLSHIVFRGKHDSNDLQGEGQEAKKVLGLYGPKRLRQLQVQAARMASGTSRWQILQMLLDITQESDCQEGRAILLLAVEKKDSEFCTFLLERDLDLDDRDSSDNTALHIAAKTDQPLIIEALLRRGADVGTLNSTRCSPLQTALDAGSFSVFIQLLKQSTADMRRNLKLNEPESTDPFKSDEEKAMERKMISLLLQEDFTASKDVTGRMALSWATEYTGYKSPVVMTYFVQLDGDINARDNLGRTALSYAAAHPDYKATDLVKTLLGAGADPEIGDNLGKTPLLYALERGSYYSSDVVGELLNSGANANVIDASGVGTIGYVFGSKDIQDYTARKIIEKLLNAGMDPNRKDSSGKTALFYVVEKPNDLSATHGFFWKLLRAGANPDITDSSEKTVRDYASKHTDDSLCEILRIHDYLKAGTDLNAKDDSGKTPLFYVTESKIDPDVQADMVQALLDAGANPNVQDDKGRTPIFAAGRVKNSSKVWYTLKNGGADLKIRDSSGRRPSQQSDFDRRYGYSYYDTDSEY